MRRISQHLRHGFIGGGLLALGAVLAGAAQAQTVGPLVQVTGADPFTFCTADRVAQQEAAFDSTVFPNTVIEPSVAVDPANPDHLIVGHHQDRWTDGGARGLVGEISANGGSSWSQSIPGGVTECTGGNFIRASDPWITFAPDGTAFFFSLVIDPAQTNTPFGARDSGTLVSRSTDGGQTWGPPTTLIQVHTNHALNDKNSITADPTAQGNVYAVWDQLSVFPTNGDKTADELLSSNDGVEIARNLAGFTATAGGAPSFKFNFTGPTFFASTATNGAAWSSARIIFDPGTNAQTINNIVVVPPSGTVFDFFTTINVTGSPGILSIGHIQSADKGATFGGVSFATDIKVVKIVSPDSGQAIRDASILYGVATNSSNGALYLVWQDDRFTTVKCTTPGGGTIPIDAVAFSQSTDGGVTWSKPVQINQTPVNTTNPCRQQAFIPQVTVTADGTIAVTYYDFRNDTNTPSGFEGTDYFALFCSPTTANPCTNPANWGHEQRLTPSPFNILDAPAVASGHFLGDYMGLTASGQVVTPVFGIATSANVTADFTRKITVP